MLRVVTSFEAMRQFMAHSHVPKLQGVSAFCPSDLTVWGGRRRVVQIEIEPQIEKQTSISIKCNSVASGIIKYVNGESIDVEHADKDANHTAEMSQLGFVLFQDGGSVDIVVYIEFIPLGFSYIL